MNLVLSRWRNAVNHLGNLMEFVQINIPTSLGVIPKIPSTLLANVLRFEDVEACSSPAFVLYGVESLLLPDNHPAILPSCLRLPQVSC